jgi:hypothetical protein
MTLTVSDVMNDIGRPVTFLPGDIGTFDPGEYGLVEEAELTIGKIGDEP